MPGGGGDANDARTTLKAQDRIAADRFRTEARDAARAAAGLAGELGDAPRPGLDAPDGVERARAAFRAARLWEVAKWERFQSLARGARPGLGDIWPGRPTFPPPDPETLAEAELMLRDIARRLDEAASNTASVLVVPGDARPPQHARLREGVNARVLANQLLGLHAGAPEIAAADASVREWILRVAETLDGLQAAMPGAVDPSVQFRSLTQGIEATGNPLVADPASLIHAYVQLGLDYIMEVHRKMPDYAEASGQRDEPRSVITVEKGGIIYVGQVAEKIINIDSEIQGVANRGDRRVADGLRAVENAVLDDKRIDNETRGDLLDTVGYLAESAQKEPSERRRGMVKKALDALRMAAAAGGQIDKAMTAWGDVLHTILSAIPK
jgi:hypothetical protein